MSDLDHECGVCGARYYGAGAASACCCGLDVIAGGVGR